MKRINPLILLTIADVFVNLSAGWFGAAFILPASSEHPLSVNIPILFFDIFFGIVCFIIAFKIRNFANKKKRK